MPFHNGIAFIFPNFTPSNNKKYIGRYLIGKRKETYNFLSFFSSCSILNILRKYYSVLSYPCDKRGDYRAFPY